MKLYASFSAFFSSNRYFGLRRGLNAGTLRSLFTGLLLLALFARADRAEAAAIKVNGVTFAANSVAYYPDGKIKEIFFDKPVKITIGKLALEIRTHVWLYKSGRFVTVMSARDFESNGILYAKGSDTRFYETGELKSGYLAKNAEIQGYTYCGDNFVTFYKTGELFNGSIAEDRVIQGVPCKAGAVVTWYRSGKLRRATTFYSVTINGTDYYGPDPENELSFYESGKVQSGTLAKDTVFNGIKMAGGSRAGFYESGKFRSGHLGQDLEREGYKFRPSSFLILDDIYFYESGKLKGGDLAENTVIRGIKFKNTVYFYETGELREGALAEETELEIAGQKAVLPDRTRVVFDKSGKVLGITFYDRAQVLIGNRKVWTQETDYYSFTDWGKKAVDSVGGWHIGAAFKDNSLSLDFNEVRFIWEKFYDYDERYSKSIMSMEDADFYYNGAKYHLKPFAWMNFTLTGEVIQ